MKASVYIPDKLWNVVKAECAAYRIDTPNLSHLLQETLMNDFNIEEVLAHYKVVDRKEPAPDGHFDK